MSARALVIFGRGVRTGMVLGSGARDSAVAALATPARLG